MIICALQLAAATADEKSNEQSLMPMYRNIEITFKQSID